MQWFIFWELKAIVCFCNSIYYLWRFFCVCCYMPVGQSWGALLQCLFYTSIKGAKALLFIRSCLNWFLCCDLLLCLFCGVCLLLKIMFAFSFTFAKICNPRLFKKRRVPTTATNRNNSLVWTHLSRKGKARVQEWFYMRLMWCCERVRNETSTHSLITCEIHF